MHIPADATVSGGAASPAPTSASVPIDNETVVMAVSPAGVAADPAPELDDRPLTGALIGIDPGHQRRGDNTLEPVAPGSSQKKARVTSGTEGVATGIPEYRLNLEVGLLLRDRLEELGAEVIMTRDVHDINISNAERAKLTNDANSDLVIRIHADGSNNRALRGAKMLVPSGIVSAQVQTVSRSAGEIVFAAFLRATDARSEGVIPRSDLTGFNWSTVPVILIEMGYMSNPDEDRLLNTPEYQAKIVDGLSQGIVDWWER